MKAIKLPFGLNENNILVHSSDVERGKECNCVCPECGSALIASKGKIKQPHFKHAVDNVCEGGFESAIHLAAKRLIREAKRITVSGFVVAASKEDSKGKEHSAQKIIVEDGVVINFDSVQEEVPLAGMRVDLLGEARKIPLIIEIFYRHKVDEQKHIKILEGNISAIEIDLSALKPDDIKDWKAFEAYVNDPSHVKWINNAKTLICYDELKKQVAEAIRKQETIYVREELERQRKEQKEKAQLQQALEELKILSGEESVAHFKQEAEAHPFWKEHSKYLPFSFSDLPYYVNVDVPDGDWIFGCDRRIWQTAFYKSFVFWANFKWISVENVVKWLCDKIGCKVPLSVEVAGRYSKRYRELIPIDMHNNRPSTWKTLYRYFSYLENLGMVEFSRDIYDHRSKWFKVISKYPK